MSTIGKVRLEQPYVATDANREAGRAVRELVARLMEMSTVDPVLKRAQLGTAMWHLTLATGQPPNAKYNTRFVSRGVVDGDPNTKVNHEHVHPRKVVLDALLSERSWEASDLDRYLQSVEHPCIVTLTEHALLGGVSGSGWDRYAKAGIDVFDRERKRWLDLDSHRVAADPATAPASAQLGVRPGRSAAESSDPRPLIEERATSPQLLAELLHFVRMATAEGVVGRKHDGSPTHYFRVHDVLLDEPTRAVAYVHWSGTIDLALQLEELPEGLQRDERVARRTGRGYDVRFRLHAAEDVETAAALVELALERVRDSFEQLLE